MGLAVLPARLKKEMADLEDAMINGKDIAAIDDIAKHKEWADMIMKKYDVTAENCHDILKEEIGLVFTEILEQCGVFERTEKGKAQFVKFLERVNAQ